MHLLFPFLLLYYLTILHNYVNNFLHFYQLLHNCVRPITFQAFYINISSHYSVVNTDFFRAVPSIMSTSIQEHI